MPSSTPTTVTKTKKMNHVSVTGMDVQSWWLLPTFIRFARDSMIQAKNSEGNVHAEGGYSRGVHHTLTVWEDRDAMSNYLRSGAHKEAMARSKDIGTFVQVYGYDSDEIPSMKEAIQLWQEYGRVVFQLQKRNEKQSTVPSVSFIFLLGCAFLGMLHVASQSGFVSGSLLSSTV